MFTETAHWLYSRQGSGVWYQELREELKSVQQTLSCLLKLASHLFLKGYSPLSKYLLASTEDALFGWGKWAYLSSELYSISLSTDNPFLSLMGRLPLGSNLSLFLHSLSPNLSSPGLPYGKSSPHLPQPFSSQICLPVTLSHLLQLVTCWGCICLAFVHR